MSVLRSHGSGRWPQYSPVNGAMAAPCMHAGGMLAASQTTASWVSELRRDGALHWATATAAPCTSLFKPFAVERPADLGPAPSDRFDARTLWWRHELLHRLALRAPDTALPKFSAERDEIERRWSADPPPSQQAVSEADALLSRWTSAVSEGVRDDNRPSWVRRYWRIRDRRSAFPAITPNEPQGLVSSA